MSSEQAQFDKAVKIVRGLPPSGPIKPSQADQLFFYKNFKQATEGDVNVTRPGFVDFTGKAKWDAWNEVKDTPKIECQAAYVKKLLEILKAADTEEARMHVVEIEEAH